MQIQNIVLAPDDNYAKHCAVVMASVLANAHKDTDIRFHILDGGISEDNVRALKSVDAGRPYKINFARINRNDFCDFPSMKYISVSTWYRLKIASLLPEDIDRILYLDCDVIVKAPLDELFEMPLGGCIIAGAPDNLWKRYAKTMGLPADYPYFNAGVLLIDLAAWRKENIEKLIFGYLHEDQSRLALMDQNLLNILLHEKMKPLHVKWNFQYGRPFLEDTCFYDKLTCRQYTDAFYSPMIIHYMGVYKPWNKGIGVLNKFGGEYYKYLKYTPWRFASAKEEELFLKEHRGIKSVEFLKKLASNLRHKPLLCFRKYYIGRLVLAVKTRLSQKHLYP